MKKVMFSYVHAGSNPALDRIAVSLEGEGFTVKKHSFREIAAGRVDVLHIHWPEMTVRSGQVSARLLGLTKITILLLVARLRRTATVWTIHNLSSHEVQHAYSERSIRRICATLIDRVIAMSPSVKSEIIVAIPNLKRAKVRVVPHPHYRMDYSLVTDVDAVRLRYGIDKSEYVILFFGLIRDYKNVPELIRVFQAVGAPNTTLLIAGVANPHLREEIESLALGDVKIRLMLRFIDEEEVAPLFAASDLCVLPFVQILNSGSALLSLSLNTPVVLPRMPSLQSLQQEFGEQWVRFFDPPLNAVSLSDAMGRTPTGDIEIEHRSPSAVARMTAAVYNDVLSFRSRPRGLETSGWFLKRILGGRR